MARLPQPGGDQGQWGDVLNEYLSVSHNNDGTLKAASVGPDALQAGSIPLNKLSTPVAPSPGQTLTYDGTGLAWASVSASGTVPDANATTKGLVRLAGDIAGTADSPTIPGLASKEPAITSGTSGQYFRGDKSWQTLDKTAVGLTNVDNTADVNKPLSTATQTALSAKADQASLANYAPLNSPAFTGTPTGISAANVGLGNVNNTSDINKPVSSATQTALNGKANVTHTHAATDIVSGTLNASLLPAATSTTAGAVTLAATSDVVTGTDTTKAATSAGVKAAIGAIQPNVIFVNTLSDIPVGTPVDTLVVVRAP